MAQNNSYAEALSDDVVDFAAVLELWAADTAKTSLGRTDGAGLAFVFSWDKMRVTHRDPVFTDQLESPIPTTQVLFQSKYSNGSSLSQPNNFRAERTTTSRAELTVQEGVCLPVDGVRVLLPPAVASAHAGFPTELNVCKKDRKSWEETLKWSVDTQITVGARQTTKAKMVVEEKQWSGGFSVTTEVTGKVRAVVRDAITDKQLTTIAPKPIRDIFDAVLSSSGNKGGPSIQLFDKGVRFITKGHLNFRYGIEQRVDVEKEEPL